MQSFSHRHGVCAVGAAGRAVARCIPENAIFGKRGVELISNRKAVHTPLQTTGKIKETKVFTAVSLLIHPPVYRVDRNNFYKRQKKATIFTPDYVSDFLYAIFHSQISKRSLVIDPCVGQGSLLKPWKQNGYNVIGIDIEYQGFPKTIVRNYLEITKGEVSDLKPDLVIMNPPFNIDQKTKAYIRKHYGGRPLLPEVWLQKAIELFGSSVPIVMFTPYGFRLNQSQTSKRWQKFIEREYPEITTIISLPKDVFKNILFHSEVLAFNMPELKGHYFLQQQDVEKRRVEAA